MSRVSWAADEHIFRELYTTGGPDAVMQRLPARSRNSVLQQAHRLGLKAPKLAKRHGKWIDPLPGELRRRAAAIRRTWDPERLLTWTPPMVKDRRA